MKKQHRSDSSVQKSIEVAIIEELKLKNEKVVSSGVSFEFDGYKEEHGVITEIYEIYCGIDDLKPGQKRKIASDILKMITYQEVAGRNVIKNIIVVDARIKELLTKHYSWMKQAIERYSIDVKVANIEEEKIALLRETKKKQRR